MSEQQNDQSSAPDADKAGFLHRLLDRVSQSLERVEQQTVAGIQHEIEQAVELEAAAEDMTREEMDLLGAYLKRDLQSLSRFVSGTGKGLAEWLSFDLHLMEDRLLKLLLSISDRTVLEQEQFQQILEEHQEVYMAGEQVLPGSFSCALCGEPVTVTAPSVLEKCPVCGRVDFQRISRI